jgi:hypothetical protein
MASSRWFCCCCGLRHRCAPCRFICSHRVGTTSPALRWGRGDGGLVGGRAVALLHRCHRGCCQLAGVEAGVCGGIAQVAGILHAPDPGGQSPQPDQPSDPPMVPANDEVVVEFLQIFRPIQIIPFGLQHPFPIPNWLKSFSSCATCRFSSPTWYLMTNRLITARQAAAVANRGCGVDRKPVAMRWRMTWRRTP